MGLGWGIPTLEAARWLNFCPDAFSENICLASNPTANVSCPGWPIKMGFLVEDKVQQMKGGRISDFELLKWFYFRSNQTQLLTRWKVCYWIHSCFLGKPDMLLNYKAAKLQIRLWVLQASHPPRTSGDTDTCKAGFLNTSHGLKWDGLTKTSCVFGKRDLKILQCAMLSQSFWLPNLSTTSHHSDLLLLLWNSSSWRWAYMFWKIIIEGMLLPWNFPALHLMRGWASPWHPGDMETVTTSSCM